MVWVLVLALAAALFLNSRLALRYYRDGIELKAQLERSRLRIELMTSANTDVLNDILDECVGINRFPGPGEYVMAASAYKLLTTLGLPVFNEDYISARLRGSPYWEGGRVIPGHGVDFLAVVGHT